MRQAFTIWKALLMLLLFLPGIMKHRNITLQVRLPIKPPVKQCLVFM